MKKKKYNLCEQLLAVCVVSVPDTEWHIETSGGSKLTYFKGLSLQQVIDSFYESNDRNDHIVSIKNFAQLINISKQTGE